MTNKITIGLWTFFFLIVSLNNYAQVNSFTLLEDNSSNLRYQTSQDFKFEQTKSQFMQNQNLAGLIKPNERALNFTKTSYPSNPFSKNSSFLSKKPLQTNDKKSIMTTNRRLKYSSLWAFTSLNYLYADLVGIMDVNLLSQYQTGIVNGIEITPAFLTAASAFMQMPLSNVFLPHVIKNDNTLRWVQIVCGSIATVVQGATLFVGEPAPYYVLFSVIEMGVTSYITIDAIRWKTQKRNKKKAIDLF